MAGGKEGRIERGIGETGQAGGVVEVRAGKGQSFEGLIELEDSVGEGVVSQLGDVVGLLAGESELGETTVGGAVSPGEGEGDVGDGAAAEGFIAVNKSGGGGGGDAIAKRQREEGAADR